MDKLRTLLSAGDCSFWNALQEWGGEDCSFMEWQKLSTLRKRAVQQLAAPEWPELRIALIGGFTLTPFTDFLALALAFRGFQAKFFTGPFDSATQEILDPQSELYAFSPSVTLFFPSIESLPFKGSLFAPQEEQRQEISGTARTVTTLCRSLSEKTNAPVILANFAPETGHDPGSVRSSVAGFSWTYRRLLNTELGFSKSSGTSILDVEFLATRFGALQAQDERSWLEFRQPFAADFLVLLARESAQLVDSLRRPMKKVLVLDLDNTLWGGVVGDDGVEGIELGDTSVRGEAFKRFQRHILQLNQRGVLLAVCSRNEEATAKAPFEHHLESVLKLEHFSAFRANWKPKPDNLVSIAQELNIGLESFVFVDDNPAEVEAVKQFTPEVACLLLGNDPCDYVQTLKDCRYFEPLALTLEDSQRPGQYKALSEAAKGFDGVTNVAEYLQSLQMQATLLDLSEANLSRAAQLINKSNQFNVTTIRRTEAELKGLSSDKDFRVFTVRLNDRLVDHGLVSVVVLQRKNEALEIDTWVMSCRVLNRKVERLVLREIVATARSWGSKEVLGRYLPTAKNGLVKNLYSHLGFVPVSNEAATTTYRMFVSQFQDSALPIKLRRPNESEGSSKQAPVSL